MMANANRYRHLLGKIIYLIVTRPHITYVVSVLSQFMHEPRMIHWEFLHISSVPLANIYQRLCIEAYSNAGYAGDKGDRKSTTGYCPYVGGNLVTCTKVVSCLSAKAEYPAMAASAREMIWLQSFIQDLGITTPMYMPMQCDNQEAIFISGNLAFHERTKHIEINCHFICDKV